MSREAPAQPAPQEPAMIILSVWIGLVFWIGLFWVAGVLCQLLDTRLNVITYAPVWLKGVGLLLTILGLLLIFLSSYELVTRGGGSPNPLLAPPKQLVTHGLYAYLRHPMYLGFIAVAFGYGFLLDSLSFTVIVAPIVLVALTIRASLEERSLAKRHGEAYHRYRKATPGFYPRLFVNHP